MENAIGQEAGQLIGDYTGKSLQGLFNKEPSTGPQRVYDPNKRAFVDRSGNAVVLPTQMELDRYLGVAGIGGERRDTYGNPVTPISTLADSGEITTDVTPGLLTGSADQNPNQTPQITTQKLKSGDSYWRIAQDQLGPEASNADVQRQVYALMELNPGLDPRTLQAGQTINLIMPNAGTTISAGTLAAYGASDAGYQADREERGRVAMQADIADMFASVGPVNQMQPLADAPGSSGPQSSGGIAEGRASMRAYWENVQDSAASEGSFLTYLGASVMGKLGEVGYGLAEKGVAVYNDPEGALVGAGKAVVNFGPEAFNAATNLTKASLNGYTLLAEAAGVPDGTFAGFRETDPYNLTPLATYNNQAEEGGALLANLAVVAGVAKFGKYEIGGAGAGAGAGATRLTGGSFAANEIRFSQNSVSFGKVDRATGQAYTYDDLVTSMRTNGWKGDPVDVVRMPDGRLTSIDNTRIRAAREAGIDVQANVRAFDSRLTANEIGRFTKGSQIPSTWGDAVTTRINSQTGGFGVKYPYGAGSLPRVTGRPK